MKKRGDYLKKAYYHLMKIEQKKNKILQVENYGEINAELNRKLRRASISIPAKFMLRTVTSAWAKVSSAFPERAGRSD